MDILDFEFLTAPIIQCDEDGRITGMNPAAKALSPKPRKGSRLILTASPCTLPQGRCLVIPHEGSLWLVFCDFLRFDYNGAVYPTTLEAMMLSGEDLLRAAAYYGALRRSPSVSGVKRLRELLYSRFSFIFTAKVDPYRAHSVSSVITAFSKVLPSEHIRFTAESGSTRLLNTRNTTVLMTALLAALLPYAKGRVTASAGAVGDDLRLCVSARTELTLQSSQDSDLSALFRYFPEHAVDLYVADLCIRTCGYTTLCRTDEDGTVSVDIYIKTETNLNAVLEPTSKVPFEKELRLLAEKLG